jgi:putative ABC transport system ATP-binding protein
MSPMIEARGLSRIYPMGSERIHALAGVDLQVEKGEFVALMGPSGSGKSTLMHILGCLDQPDEGSYLLDGQDTGSLSEEKRAHLRNTHIGFIFQTFNLLARTSALENAALPLFYGTHHGEWQQKARSALERVGLGKRLQHRPSELSGGEQQRVAIARALVNDPLLILADEPTGNLDSARGAEILQLLVDLWHEGRTLLIITHDSKIASFAKRVITLHDGHIISEEVQHVMV